MWIKLAKIVFNSKFDFRSVMNPSNLRNREKYEINPDLIEFIFKGWSNLLFAIDYHQWIGIFQCRIA